MADGVAITAGSGTTVATDDAGAAGHVQIVKLAISTDASATAIPADATNGIDVDVTRLPALVAGTANIGDVDVLTVPADPFGANADAAATAGGTGSIQAKLRNLTSTNDAIKTAVEVIDNAISGSEMQVDVVAALPAGTNNIGDVDVLTLPGVAGTVAHDAGDSGNPVKVGGRAEATNITAVSDGDRTDFVTDLYGRQRVVSSASDKVPTGIYYYSTQFTVSATAHTASGDGFGWLANIQSSTVTMRVRSIQVVQIPAATTAFTTSPRIRLGLFTYTGTASGTTVDPAKRRTADATNVGFLRTANTGMTITPGATIYQTYVSPVLTGVGYSNPSAVGLHPQEFDESIELGSGEGIRIIQLDAGSASDTRKFVVNIVVEEYTG